MQTVFQYIRWYFYESDKVITVLVTLVAGLLIFTNYYYGLDSKIADQSFLGRFCFRFIIYFSAFIIPYLLLSLSGRSRLFDEGEFVLLLFIAPAIFSLKASLYVEFPFSPNESINNYWNQVAYWPFLLLVVTLLLIGYWLIFDNNNPFYGTYKKTYDWKPYWVMLLVMIPLIATAATQPDFLAVYPKLQSVNNIENFDLDWWHMLLYELSYGSDFVGIELFFRGFLIIGFVKFAGKDVVLPMASFYCTIHFGKPLGECISSYFGALLLGIVVLNTRSIWGGLMVHLGIAWLMELAGYLGGSQ